MNRLAVIAYELRRLADPANSRAPMTLARRWWWRFVIRWRTEICDRCGRPVSRWLSTWWNDTSGLWLRVVGSPQGTWCPRCFTERAEQLGLWIYWQPVRDKSTTWVAFHSDYSEMAVFADELDARRYANENYMQVALVNEGEGIREQINRAYREAAG